jgi:hypothetical protein
MVRKARAWLQLTSVLVILFYDEDRAEAGWCHNSVLAAGFMYILLRVSEFTIAEVLFIP